MNGNVADDDFNDKESDKWWNSLKFIIVNKWNASSKRWLEKKWKVIHMQRRWANVKTNAVAVAGRNLQIMCHFMQMESKEVLTKKMIVLSILRFFDLADVFGFRASGLQWCATMEDSPNASSVDKSRFCEDCDLTNSRL